RISWKTEILPHMGQNDIITEPLGGEGKGEGAVWRFDARTSSLDTSIVNVKPAPRDERLKG
ncbi:MAG: hypothetical protein ACE5KJ_05305, partial [Candidatus Zixiibacteriota bacterium]